LRFSRCPARISVILRRVPIRRPAFSICWTSFPPAALLRLAPSRLPRWFPASGESFGTPWSESADFPELRARTQLPSQPASERVALRAGGPANYRAFARVASLGAHRASNGAVALRLDFSAAKKVFLARAPTVFLLRVYGLGACRASVAFQLQGGSCASSKTRPFPSRGPGETVESGYDSRRGILQAS